MTTFTLRRSDLAQRLIYLDGRPFSLEGYDPHFAFYNTSADKVLLMCGRQVAKSTTLSNVMIAQSVAVPQFKSLFVAPSKEQTSKFSNTRVMKSMQYSPLIRKYYIDAKRTNSVMTRMLTNGSEMFFSYCTDDPDRVRGISADQVLYDEVQSMMLREIVPVINECMGASPYKKNIFCGTPLSAENDIEIMWQGSSQYEWLVYCPTCGNWNILGLGNLADDMMRCAKDGCNSPIDVAKGQWFSLNPKSDYQGFRIPQTALAYNVSTPKAYRSILNKRRDYSHTKFMNEVLGVSDEQGARLISQEQLFQLCNPNLMMSDASPSSIASEGIIHYVAGVDHSGYGATQENSRTALSIYGIGYDNTKVRCVYGKVYKTGHPIQDVEDIVRICTNYNVSLVVADEGGGALANAELRNRLGAHRVIGCRYGASHGGIKWNEKSATPSYNVDKTMLIDQVMQMVLHKQMEFPMLAQMKSPFFDDILSEYEETTASGRRIWKNSAARPDDFLHALAYAWLAASVIRGTTMLYAPREID